MSKSDEAGSQWCPPGERRGGVGESMEIGLKGTSEPHRASSLMLDWAVYVFRH